MIDNNYFVRIVKMEFQEDKIELFLTNFNLVKDKIRNQPGNRLLEMYRDKNNTNIFFTYSYWENESDLENYKQTELFQTVWAKTKVFFSAKPEAWSVDKITICK
ncbi:MAG TPA: antibiotic biosynthesis monooxygenase [Flavobacteriaceae bacterium]|nr:antibiotic biosynthesis monooxygenase [Flavobacteriaceae bacterium]HIP26045.1 antibiotic biosynthesis monooxygenase [Flavobacteriaceae bacterium]